MNRTLCGLIVTLGLLSGGLATAADSESLSSTKDHGIVSVQPEPALSDGRLVLKVVAFNRTRSIASFGGEDIEIKTADGKKVNVLTVEQLVAEARGEGQAERNGTVNHNPAEYSGPSMHRNSAGEPDVSNYTGGMSTAHQSSAPKGGNKKKKNDPETEKYVAALEAAILKSQTVASGATVGGQVVSEKLKFRKKDNRALHMVITFNGDQHEFDVVAPAD